MKARYPRKKKKKIKKAFGDYAYNRYFREYMFQNKAYAMADNYLRNYKGIFDKWQVKDLLEAALERDRLQHKDENPSNVPVRTNLKFENIGWT